MDLFSEKDFEDGKKAQAENNMPSVKIKKEKKISEKKIEHIVDTLDYEDDEERKKFYIIDGFGLIFRSYYAFFMNPLYDRDGNNFSAIYGFFNSLSMLLREYKPDYLVVALDSKGPTFRHEMYNEYKANRDEAPADLKAQIPVIIELLELMQIPTISKVGLEADDIIASLCDKAIESKLDAIMFTADKDLLQLVNKRVFALRPPKKGQKNYRLFGTSEVEEEFFIRPDQIVDYLTLLGDTADNIPGVLGIGAKTAVKLLNKFDNLDNIYKSVNTLSKGVQKKLVEGKENAILSKSLVELFRDPNILDGFDLAKYSLDNLNLQAAIPFFEKQNSRSLIASFKKLMNPQELRDFKSTSHEDISKAIEEEKEDEVKIDESLLGQSTLHPLTSIEELEKLFEKIANGPKLMAFDTETTSVDALNCTLVGFSFAYEPKEDRKSVV